MVQPAPNSTGQPVQPTSTHAYSSVPSPPSGSSNPVTSARTRAFQHAAAAHAEASTHASDTMGKLKQKLSAAGEPVAERRERIHEKAITRLNKEIEETPSLSPGTKEALHKYLGTLSFDDLSTEELEFLQLHDLLLPCIQFYRERQVKRNEELNRHDPILLMENALAGNFEDHTNTYESSLEVVGILTLYDELTELYAKEFEAANKMLEVINEEIDINTSTPLMGEEITEAGVFNPAKAVAYNIDTSRQTIDDLKIHRQALIEGLLVKHEKALEILDSSFKDPQTLPPPIEKFRNGLVGEDGLVKKVGLVGEIEKLRALHKQNQIEGDRQAELKNLPPVFVYLDKGHIKKFNEIYTRLTTCEEDLQSAIEQFSNDPSLPNSSMVDLLVERKNGIVEMLIAQYNQIPVHKASSSLRKNLIDARNQLLQRFALPIKYESLQEHLVAYKKELSNLENEEKEIKSRTTIKTGPLGIIDSPEVIRSDDDTKRWNELQNLIPKARVQKDSLINDLVLQYDQALAHIKAASRKLGVKKVPQEIVDLRKRLEGERDKLLGELTRPPLRIQLRKIWINLFGKKTEASP